MTTYDDILKTIGEFGPFQKRVYILLCLPALPLLAMLGVHVFVLGVPEHRCKIEGLDNDTYAIQDLMHEVMVNASIPLNEKGKYDRCHYYVEKNVTVKCSEWVYDDSVYTFTFAQQLNMVCDNSIKIPVAQMILYFGLFVGSLLYGQLSDIIGRRKTLYLSLLVLLGSSCGLVGMVEYVGFCILLFLIGGACLGYVLCAYVLSMEMVGPSKRMWAGNVIYIFFACGSLLLILLVYLFRNWRYFTLAIGLQLVFFLPYYWLIPESPRWLLSKDRKEEAIDILQRTAKANKKELNAKLLDGLTEAPPQGRVWQLFSNRILGFRTTIIFWNWFVCSMSYYGTVMNIDNFSGDLFINFTLMTVAEFPAKLITMTLLDRVGRKRLHMGYLFVGGVACLGTMWPIIDGRDELQPVLISLAMVGKLCMVGAFGTVYVLSTEIYPTVVRNAGMGASSAFSRIGSMIAPYIARSATLVGGVTGEAIPLTLFGAAMFLAGLSTIFLPETLNRHLPESIEDAINMKQRKLIAQKDVVGMSNCEKDVVEMSNCDNGGFIPE